MDQQTSPPCPWDLRAMSAAPRVTQAPRHEAEGLRAIFFDGPPRAGRPTRVFAYIGVPELRAGEKAPAMVLVHGGWGTAYTEWVRLWTRRGYAAIAMDTCGCVPEGGPRDWLRHEHGGPPGWGGFEQADQPPQEQWPYHAVAAVILAHSLIREHPQVDPDRVGITGVSWGGYLACIAAGLDPRFKLAAPVYGCGFLRDCPCWAAEFEKMGPDAAARWFAMWDPSRYLPRARLPMLWVTGTNDGAYPLNALQQSYRLPSGPRWLCVTPRMPHGHGGPGENPPEIHAFADFHLRGGAPLTQITAAGREDGAAWVTFKCSRPIVQAELHYTRGGGKWQDREWLAAPATLDPRAGMAAATLPEGVSVCYINITDERGLVVSSEHVEF